MLNVSLPLLPSPSPPPMPSSIFQFDMWEALDPDSRELARTSEFWAQVQLEADRLDIVEPSNFSDQTLDEPDWGISESPDFEEMEFKANIIQHDCMWAGLEQPTNTFVRSDLVPAIPGQSLLRRDVSPPRPDTPPSIEGDEPPQFRHAVDVAGTALRLLRDSAAVAADHSYTARQQFDNLGVQTPSDSCESEEEIDVVSLGTTQEILTLSPEVQTDVLPYVSGRPSQERQVYYRNQESTVTTHTPRPAGRKKLVPPPSIQSAATPRRRRGQGRRGRRSNTDTESDEVETPEIERRSIHNDMERQRRIGLKNLFDELKKQIPAIKDKERAPKVAILREAASLCRKLYHDDLEREKLRKKQHQLHTKLKKLRTLLSARYRTN